MRGKNTAVNSSAEGAEAPLPGRPAAPRPNQPRRRGRRAKRGFLGRRVPGANFSETSFAERQITSFAAPIEASSAGLVGVGGHGNCNQKRLNSLARRGRGLRPKRLPRL